MKATRKETFGYDNTAPGTLYKCNRANSLG